MATDNEPVRSKLTDVERASFAQDLARANRLREAAQHAAAPPKHANVEHLQEERSAAIERLKDAGFFDRNIVGFAPEQLSNDDLAFHLQDLAERELVSDVTGQNVHDVKPGDFEQVVQDAQNRLVHQTFGDVSALNKLDQMIIAERLRDPASPNQTDIGHFDDILDGVALHSDGSGAVRPGVGETGNPLGSGLLQAPGAVRDGGDDDDDDNDEPAGGSGGSNNSGSDDTDPFAGSDDPPGSDAGDDDPQDEIISGSDDPGSDPPLTEDTDDIGGDDSAGDSGSDDPDSGDGFNGSVDVAVELDFKKDVVVPAAEEGDDQNDDKDDDEKDDDTSTDDGPTGVSIPLDPEFGGGAPRLRAGQVPIFAGDDGATDPPPDTTGSNDLADVKPRIIPGVKDPIFDSDVGFGRGSGTITEPDSGVTDPLPDDDGLGSIGPDDDPLAGGGPGLEESPDAQDADGDGVTISIPHFGGDISPVAPGVAGLNPGLSGFDSSDDSD